MTTPTDRVRAALEYVLENNAYIHSQISFSEVQEKLTEALATMDGMVLVPVEPTSECTVCSKEIPFTKHRGNMQCQKHSHLSF